MKRDCAILNVAFILFPNKVLLSMQIWKWELIRSLDTPQKSVVGSTRWDLTVKNADAGKFLKDGRTIDKEIRGGFMQHQDGRKEVFSSYLYQVVSD
jgi:hypothetical protein